MRQATDGRLHNLHTVLAFVLGAGDDEEKARQMWMAIAGVRHAQLTRWSEP
ncbi:hypothetical protein ACFRIB_38890 [Streptomyces mirabilis]|uniref:hypothetical protein n=1 Tax=Streptomyces mirabilis TaxID=68239 RepID=UPI00367BB389